MDAGKRSAFFFQEAFGPVFILKNMCGQTSWKCDSTSFSILNSSDTETSDQMWIVIASILACFKVGRKKDEFGDDIKISDDFIDNGPTRQAMFTSARNQLSELYHLITGISRNTSVRLSLEQHSSSNYLKNQ